ncbi:MAG: zinc transporter substrate-binding protein [Bacillales bacterium]|jgi:zinc transport system substrate-binding protein|nr:zinc transporter substrate-binding protein [Bacillales bacterium]
MSFNKVFRISVLTVSFLGLLSGCGSTPNEEKSKEEKIHILTTFYPMYEFAKNVAGENADVELLIPSNIEPHDWEPSPKDMAKIQNADMIIYNSEHFETWVPDVEKNLTANDKPLFVNASEDIELIEGIEEHEVEGHKEDEHGHEEESHEVDPHVWLSPVLAQQEVQKITEAFIKIDPNNKDIYEQNSKNYIAKLAELDQLFKDELNNHAGSEMITQHAAFGYLTREYNIKQVPISGISPEAEPSPARLAELKKFAKEHKINTIFFEELASPKVAKTLAAEIGAKTDVLNTLEGLSKEDQKKGLNYIEVMKKNLNSIEKSFSQQ